MQINLVTSTLECISPDFQLANLHISEETLIVIDDAPIFAPMKIEDKKLSVITEHPAPKPFVGGKGYLVNEFAYASDATLYFSNYQTAWFNFKKKF